jgi:hypothetical protein
MSFPPVPVFPKAIDSCFELFLVYNTTEARMSVDNAPWSQEIEIVPRKANEAEIWADNGFGNISGELFYYDSVEKDINDRVFKLKACARNLGGSETVFNKKGTWVRSYVVAEHHNQIVDTILKIEDFVGFNFDPRTDTLDWRIRNLQELSVIFDDHDCPDINFTFNITESDPVSGVVSDYLVEISEPGTFNTFRLDFGDGTSTTTDLSGTHRYAVNSIIDPVVTIQNDRCQIIQTPIERLNPTEPPPQVIDEFDIPIPEVPDFPDFTFVPCDVPEADISLPPIVFPCISIEGQIGPIPSSIEGPDLPSVIVIETPGLPSVIAIESDIPSVIILDPPIPPTIVIDPPIPPTIVIVPPASGITLDIDATELPKLEVDWGQAPDMEVALTMANQVQMPQRFNTDPELTAEFGAEFADLFEASRKVNVQYDTVGIPSEIVIVPPVMPKIEIDDIKVKVDATEVNIPDIKIHGPETPIPTDIRLNASDLPTEMNLSYKGPDKIEIDATSIPTTITVETVDPIPHKIIVEQVKPIPEEILINADDMPREITVTGMPDFVELKMPENFGIPVIFPEEMPSMELVYNGAPIEVKITMDEIIGNAEDDDNPCVKIVPCPR